MLKKLRQWLERAPNRPAEAPEGGEVRELTYPQAFALLDERMGAVERQWAEVLDKINRWSAREGARRRKELADNMAAAMSDKPSEGAALAPGQQWDKAALRRRAAMLSNRKNAG